MSRDWEQKRIWDLFHMQNMCGYSEFQREVARMVLKVEIEQRWSQMCKELKEAGYKEIWIGPCERFPYFSMNSVTASPTTVNKNSVFPHNWPPIWEIVGKLFGRSCGNGHQAFGILTFPDKYKGHHVL